MIFENLSKVTGFSTEKITEHLSALNALQNSGSCSRSEKSALMVLIGVLPIVESYLMGLERQKPLPPTSAPVPKETSKCRSCGAPVNWVKTPAGRWCPHDLDGESHFKTCPDAGRWSGKRKL